MMDTLRQEERLMIGLVEGDPDYVVDVLEISTQELLYAFPEKVDVFLKKEAG